MVSVVMLCRNEEKHIEKTLRCLLKEQEEPPKEIIVVDRSTDRSPEIARSYGCKVLRPPLPLYDDRDGKGHGA